jgi:uncharacterized protein YraI
MNPNIRRLLVGAILATSATGTSLGIGMESASAASTVYAAVHTSGDPLNVRLAPSTQATTSSRVPNRSVLPLACQAPGSYVNGAVRVSAQWDRLTNGLWVAHAYMQTNASLPSCASLDAPAAAQPAAPPATAAGTSVRTDGGPLNVRSTPSSHANLTATVANGAALTLSCQVDGESVRGTVRSTGQWDRLATGGYVSHAYVQTNASLPSCASLDAPPPPPAPSSGPSNGPSGATARTDGGPLNVRSTPSSQSGLTATVANGAALTLTCQVNGETVRGTVRSTAQWDKLAAGGYVSHAYVQTDVSLPPCAPAPGSDPTPAPPATYAGTAHTEGGPLNMRSGPAAGASPRGVVSNGGALTLSCAVNGDFISGAVRSTSQWDRLTSGNYVSHAYVQTSATLPVCDGGAPLTGGTGPVGSMTNAQYIAAAVAPAQQGYREFHVPASVTIAQSILESSWGRSGLTASDRNYFGIKCFGGSPGPIASGCHTYATYECTPGCYPTYASFRTYASITDSFRDHGSFLTTNSRYRPAFNYSNNADQFLYEIKRAGYATDPNYVSKVQNLMRQYNLYQYDRI